MNLKEKIKKNPTWELSHDIKEFCDILFKELGIRYFDYARFFPDNTCVMMFSNPSYVDFFLEYGRFPDSNIYKPPTKFLLPGKHLWMSYIDQGFLQDASSYFNNALGMTVVRQQIKYDELFNFSSAVTNTNILDIYMNQTTMLETFVALFTERFSQVLNDKSYRIQLPPQIPTEQKILLSDTSTNIKRVISHLKKIRNTRKTDNPILVADKIITLSARELQCLSGISQGLSAKQIAKNLNISFRTVEVYCTNLLSKTASKNRTELLSKIDPYLLP